ncbi:MAG: hypothetical protein NZM25_02895 [Leptospiraceae bacterium]|nr:hypothetical protein [Leptospiraceae bacterium]MDW8307216.1 hypothetical protein [Leptospiraceae bacterium]
MDLRLFHHSLEVEESKEALYVISPNGPVKLFSQKGRERDIKFVRSLQKPSSWLLFVSPKPSWFPFMEEVIWLEPSGRPAFGENHITTKEAWRFFLQNLTGTESFILKVHPRLPGGEEWFKLLRQDLEEAGRRLKTIRYFEKLWSWNFRQNLSVWLKTPDFHTANLSPPSVIVLGGPQVDFFWDFLRGAKVIWAADTALMPLLYHELIPHLIGSIDAKPASAEHFSLLFRKREVNHWLRQSYLLLDPLSFPLLFRLKTFYKITYRNSHPLVQEVSSAHQELFNPKGDIGGLLTALYKALFPGQELPPILGGELAAFHGISHIRGSGYMTYQLSRQNRYQTYEGYSYFLSRRYSRKNEN